MKHFEITSFYTYVNKSKDLVAVIEGQQKLLIDGIPRLTPLRIVTQDPFQIRKYKEAYIACETLKEKKLELETQ